MGNDVRITIASFGPSTVAATWLLTYWLHATVVATLTLAARRLIAAPAVRVSLMRVALVLPFLSATAVMRSRARSTDGWWSMAPTIASVVGPRARALDVDEQVTRIDDRFVRSARVVDPVGRTDARIVCALFVVVGLAGALRFGWRRSRAGRQLASRVRATINAWPPLPAGVRLTSSPHIDTALALGGGEICLPTTFGALPESERHAVLLHELAHLERHDPRWQDLGSSIAAATWLLPLNRLLVHAMRRDAEFAADARALDLGADPRALVAALARYARACDPAPVGLAGSPFTRKSSLVVARAERALEPRTSLRRPAAWGVAWRTGIVLALGLAASRLPLVTSVAPLPADSRAGAEPAGDRRIVIQTSDR